MLCFQKPVSSGELGPQGRSLPPLLQSIQILTSTSKRDIHFLGLPMVMLQASLEPPSLLQQDGRLKSLIKTSSPLSVKAKSSPNPLASPPHLLSHGRSAIDGSKHFPGRSSSCTVDYTRSCLSLDTVEGNGASSKTPHLRARSIELDQYSVGES